MAVLCISYALQVVISSLQASIWCFPQPLTHVHGFPTPHGTHQYPLFPISRATQYSQRLLSGLVLVLRLPQLQYRPLITKHILSRCQRYRGFRDLALVFIMVPRVICPVSWFPRTC
jgi:hypothetical protein